MKHACTHPRSSPSTKNCAATPTIFLVFSALSLSTHSKDGSNNRVSCTTLRSFSQVTAHGSILYKIMFLLFCWFAMQLRYDSRDAGYCCCCCCSSDPGAHSTILQQLVYYRRATLRDGCSLRVEGPISQRGIPSWPARGPPRWI